MTRLAATGWVMALRANFVRLTEADVCPVSADQLLANVRAGGQLR